MADESPTIMTVHIRASAVGRGSDIMVPMAIPTFGGITIEILTMPIVPVIYCWPKEAKIHKRPAK